MNALAGEKIANTSPVAYFPVDGSGRSDVLCCEKLSQYETLCSEPCATRHFKLWDLPLKRNGSFYQVVKAYQKWQSFLLKAHLQVQYSGCTSALLSIGTSSFFFLWCKSSENLSHSVTAVEKKTVNGRRLMHLQGFWVSLKWAGWVVSTNDEQHKDY